MGDRIHRNLREHRDFYLLLVLFVLFRLSILVLYRPGGYLVDWWDYKYYQGFAELSRQGHFPFLDYWMEYPPLFPWLVVAVYQLSLLMPAWLYPMLWFATFLGIALLVFETGNFVLVYLLALRLHEGGEKEKGRAIRAAWIYAGLALPVYYWTGWFDCFPVFFLLLAIYLIVRRRPVWAGLVTGVGFMVKLLPAIAAPIGLMALRNSPLSLEGRGAGGEGSKVGEGRRNWGVRVLSRYRRGLLFLLVAAVTVLLIALPFVLVNSTMFWASVRTMVSRSSWESIWALLDGYLRGGGIVAKFPDRFDPNTVGQFQHPSSLPWPLISAAFGLLYLFLYTRRIAWENAWAIVAFAALSLNLFMIYSQGYSPQFIVYFLPFIACLMPNARGVAYLVLLSLNSLCEWPFFHVIFIDEHPGFLVGIVLTRTILLLALSWDYWLMIRPWPRAAALWRRAFPAFVGVLLAGFALGGVMGLQAYVTDRYAADPYRPAMDHLRHASRAAPGSAVLFTSESLYYRFLPHLHDDFDMQLLRLGDPAGPARVDAALADHAQTWAIWDGTDADKPLNAALERYLSAHGFPVAVQWFENCRLTRYDPPRGEIVWQDGGWKLGEQIELVSYGLDPADARVSAGGVVGVALRWRAAAPVSGDYTAFVHLQDTAGHVVAQVDRPPLGGFYPPSQWPVGEEVRDNHALLLPADLSPGTYTLVLGFYDPATQTRLPVTDASGQPVGDAIPLTTIAIHE